MRTRADADTVEARANDTSTRDAALASGAQWVSTDYPVPNYGVGFATTYFAEIPGGTVARCNPVNAPRSCVSRQLERLQPAPLRPGRSTGSPWLRRRGSMAPMSIIIINAITVPEGSGDELAKRFAARAGAVDDQDGFEGFELLQPTDDRNVWLVADPLARPGGLQRLDELAGVRPRSPVRPGAHGRRRTAAGVGAQRGVVLHGGRRLARQSGLTPPSR